MTVQFKEGSLTGDKDVFSTLLDALDSAINWCNEQEDIAEYKEDEQMYHGLAKKYNDCFQSIYAVYLKESLKEATYVHNA